MSAAELLELLAGELEAAVYRVRLDEDGELELVQRFRDGFVDEGDRRRRGAGVVNGDELAAILEGRAAPLLVFGAGGWQILADEGELPPMADDDELEPLEPPAPAIAALELETVRETHTARLGVFTTDRAHELELELEAEETKCGRIYRGVGTCSCGSSWSTDSGWCAEQAIARTIVRTRWLSHVRGARRRRSSATLPAPAPIARAPFDPEAVRARALEGMFPGEIA